MTLAGGVRLGPYEIVEPLGAGGMGEVYRARDPRLGRDVAVKVLPEEVAQDPQRLAFFGREARAVAALNHPNILTVHDVGTHDGVPYVVTELLEGENFRELVSRRTPTVQQILGWGLQAARGLEAAHAKEIVHRDLKPENLFLTTDGRAKILDFGLAKLVRRENVATDAPTPSRSTTPGQVVGTVAYMSPEQARAHPVDARSDVFSFGVVLQELLARRHPFRRDTTAATLTAIVEETPPDLESLDRGIPPAVGGIVRRCLEKPREDRYESGHDLAVALETVLAAPSGAAALAEVEERSPYPGLSSFTEKDAEVFFGRDAEVAAVWRRLQSWRLLAVIGPSGVGKTSFVRAGVVTGRPDGWAALVCTPGTQPMLGLGRALAPELAGDREALQDLPGFEDPAVAFDLISRWRKAHGEVLLVVDQFEELFTLNAPDAQERFAGLLSRLTREADVHVLLSLRDDFLIRCHEQPALAPVFEHLTPLLGLTEEGLRQALVEPAKTRGYRFDDDALVGEMVSLVKEARGALPLLAFAAARLWEKRDREKKLLTREAYREIAGVEGALAQHAEATMDRIGPERQGLVREIFRHLITAQGTRAVVDREELLSAFPEREEAAEVLRQLIDARLLTSYEVEGKAGEPSHHRIEVVHESLLIAWPRLVRWQTQDEDSAQLRDQLKQAAHLWEEKNRTPDLLWSGTAFREYELWRERYPGQLTALEEEFSRSMAERARRRRTARRLVVTSVVVAAVAVAAVTGILWQRSDAALQRAETEVLQREAAQILSLGRMRLEGNPTAALAHALASLERADNEPARRLAVEALWRGPVAHIVKDSINPTNPVWSPDGRWLAVAGTAGLFVLDDVGGKHPLPEAGASAGASGAAAGAAKGLVGFTTDGSRLLTRGPAPDVLRLWSLPELERLETLAGFTGPVRLRDRRLLSLHHAEEEPAPQPPLLRERSIDGGPERLLGRWPQGDLPAGQSHPNGEIGPRGRWLFWVEESRVLRRRLGAADGQPQVLGRHDGARAVWAWAGGDRVATRDQSGEFRLWDAETGRLERALQSPIAKSRIRLDLSGRYAVVAPEYGDYKPGSLWFFDLEGPADAEPLVLRNDDAFWLNFMDLHPDGSLFASAHYPYGVLLWNLTARRSVVLRGQKGPLIAIAFTPDGRLLSTSDEGVVRLWPLWTDPARRVRELRSRPGRDRFGDGLDVSPDGRFALLSDRFAGTVTVLPLDGSPGTTLQVNATFDLTRRGLSPDGRRVALTAWEEEAHAIRILDLETGKLRTMRVADTSEGCSFHSELEPVQFPIWLPDGRLISEGTLGLRLWDLVDGSSKELRACRDITSEPPYIVAAPDSSSVLTVFDPRPAAGETSALVVTDLRTGESREIVGHGNRVSAIALDPTGEVLVTGDADGLVRVGPLAGGEPHLLYGHSQGINQITVSPNGRWIASAGDDETIRLWPMPDMSKPPLHVWPHEELLAKLRSFTNLRVVPDPESETGYKLEPDPYPGWRDVPTW